MKIVIIGTGNVATQLGLAFKNAKHKILQIVARNAREGTFLAIKLNSVYKKDFRNLDPSADLYVLAVSDKAIAAVLKKISLKDKLIVHTSGSVSIKIFERKFKRCGVFYPLNTILKNSKVDFRNTLICVESKNRTDEKRVFRLGKSISDRVYKINSEQRTVLHLSAVFANNFTNHMYAIAEEILKRNKMPFHFIIPMIAEAVNKIKIASPSEIQTGPAKRRDKKIIAKHLRLLSKYPEYKKIYRDVSDSIMKKYPIALAHPLIP